MMASARAQRLKTSRCTRPLYSRSGLDATTKVGPVLSRPLHSGNERLNRRANVASTRGFGGDMRSWFLVVAVAVAPAAWADEPQQQDDAALKKELEKALQ